MSPDRWNDDRLDDLAERVRDLNAAMRDTMTRLESKIDFLAMRGQWTPAVKAAVIGPAFASVIAALALVMTKT